MLEQRPQPEVERDLAREVALPVLAAARGARERAHDVPQLDEFVEIASVDELLEVLVLVAERGRGDGSGDDGRLGA
jgi:hypothetical protein